MLRWRQRAHVSHRLRHAAAALPHLTTAPPPSPSELNDHEPASLISHAGAPRRSRPRGRHSSETPQ